MLHADGPMLQALNNRYLCLLSPALPALAAQSCYRCLVSPAKVATASTSVSSSASLV